MWASMPGKAFNVAAVTGWCQASALQRHASMSLDRVHRARQHWAFANHLVGGQVRRACSFEFNRAKSRKRQVASTFPQLGLARLEVKHVGDLTALPGSSATFDCGAQHAARLSHRTRGERIGFVNIHYIPSHSRSVWTLRADDTTLL